MIPSLPPLSCESSVSVKEKPDREKKQTKNKKKRKSKPKQTKKKQQKKKKTDQKKQKDRCFTNIFAETWRRDQTEVVIRFNESVFWSWNFIILKLWKTKLEKCSSCAFYLVIVLRYFIEFLI